MDRQILFHDHETELHLRYRALVKSGWKVVVWLEYGIYYLANDELAPDWNFKRRIGLDEFETIITQREAHIGIMRKGPYEETQSASGTTKRDTGLLRVQGA